MTNQEIAANEILNLFYQHVCEILSCLSEDLNPNEPKDDFDKEMESLTKMYVGALIHGDEENILALRDCLGRYHVNDDRWNSFAYLRAFKELDMMYDKYYPVYCEVKYAHYKEAENA